MRITLENIAFNHDEDLGKTGSFFLRRCETQIVPIPEWSNRCSSDPACAPAGYVRSSLPATLTIKASICCDDLSLTSIHIQAVESPAGSTHILGPVQARPVNLKQGKSDLEVFQLPNARARIDAAGIRLSDIDWQWQFSLNGADWTDFQATAHRIYTVLEMPTRPWKPTCKKPTEIHVPWTEVLDRACKWADGIKDVDLAAAAVTRRVYELGQKKLVKYVDGGAVYAHEKFDCTKFLQLLKHGSGKGQAVNCEDCATVVSTFSNALGAVLSQSRMGSDFKTHPVLLIGYENWRRKRFGFHEVAWKGGASATDPLFDACLQIDGDGKPQVGDPSHQAVQPTNIVFGTGQPNLYKFCLFASGTCEPKPNTAQHRPFGPSPMGFPKITDVGFLNTLKEIYEFDAWEDSSEPNGSLPDTGDPFEGWETLGVTRFTKQNFPVIDETLLKRLGSSQEFVEITVYEIGPDENPNDFLLQLLGHFELLNFTRSGEREVGDVSFVAPEGVAVLFKRRIVRRNFVAAIRSVGRLETQVITMAVAVDLALRKLKPIDVLTTTRRVDMENNPGNDRASASRVPKHKLGHEFSVFINLFEENGIMDLTEMEADGTVTGTHQHGTEEETITGKATKVVFLGGSSFILRLETEDKSACYNGVLIEDKDDKLVLVGGYCFKEPMRSKLFGKRAQNDGTWVITKP